MAEEVVNLEVFLTVQGGTPEQMTKAIEKLTYMATGFAMEGLRATVNISNEDDDYDDA